MLCALAPTPARAGIDIEIHGVEGDLRGNVLAYLSFERYKTRDRLRAHTIERLHERVEREVRSALRPFGYYDPTVKSSVEPRDNGEDWRVRIDIEPGEPVVLETVDVSVTGPRAGDPVFRDILAHLPLAPVGGGLVPIILTSRADSVMARLASCAVAAFVVQARRDSAAKALA